MISRTACWARTSIMVSLLMAGLLIVGIFTGSSASRAQEYGPVSNRFGAATFIPTGEVPALAIRRIDQQVVPMPGSGPTPPLEIELFNDGVGVDLWIEGWRIPARNAGIWILVRHRDGNAWRAYGPAKEDISGDWVVRGALLGEGDDQGQKFTLRAMLAKQPLSAGLRITAPNPQQALALSDSVHLVLGRRKIFNPDPGSLSVRIATINGQTTGEREMIVATRVNLAGFVQERAADPKSASRFLQIVVHPVGTERWWVSRPAEIDGVEWRLRELNLVDLGEPHWTKYSLFALLTKEPLGSGEVPYEIWWQARLAASDSVHVSLEPRLPPVHLPASHRPAVTLETLQMIEDHLKIDRLAVTEPNAGASEPERLETMVVDRFRDLVEIQGKLAQMPHGASIWLLLNPLGSALWSAHGPAFVDAPSWRVPLVIPPRFHSLDLERLRVVAVISEDQLDSGPHRYSAWREKALAVSQTLILEQEIQDVRSAAIRLTIEEVADRKVPTSGILKPEARGKVPTTDLPIWGRVDHLPRGASIWIGTRSEQDSGWHLVGPTFTEDERWWLPGVPIDFREAFESQLIAVLAIGPLPEGLLTTEALYSQSLAMSSIVRFPPTSSVAMSPRNRSPQKISHGASLMILPSNTFWMLLIVALLVAEYFLSFASQLADYLEECFQALSQWMTGLWKAPTRLDAKDSFLGLVLLACALFAIVKYFPIYTHSLQIALGFNLEKSQSLALLMIIFTALAGVLAHLGWSHGAPLAMQVFAPMITLLLCLLQGFIYYQMFLGQAERGTQVPIAMGGMAVFIALVEVLTFYWAVQLSLDTLAWILTSTLTLPFRLLAAACHVVVMFLRFFPRRNSSEGTHNQNLSKATADSKGNIIER